MNNRRHNGSLLARVTGLPEFNVAIFALLLNYPWEFLQVPLFEQMPSAAHWEAIKTCTRATLGDAIIMLIAFWAASAFAGSRYWMSDAARRSTLTVFVLTGLAITFAIEWLVQKGLWIDSWSYSALMPVLPGVDVGLSPLAAVDGVAAIDRLVRAAADVRPWLCWWPEVQ